MFKCLNSTLHLKIIEHCFKRLSISENFHRSTGKNITKSYPCKLIIIHLNKTSPNELSQKKPYSKLLDWLCQNQMIFLFKQSFFFTFKLWHESCKNHAFFFLQMEIQFYFSQTLYCFHLLFLDLRFLFIYLSKFSFLSHTYKNIYLLFKIFCYLFFTNTAGLPVLNT